MTRSNAWPSRLVVLGPLLLALVACNPAIGGPTGGGPTSSGPTYQLNGRVGAGPTCPVVPASPLPGQCEPRSVSGAVLLITDAAGQETARITSGADGSFGAALPAGTYTITPQPFEGLMGIAPPVAVTVGPGSSPGIIQIEYDTGIR
jgi:hypothetical protein